MDQRSIISLLRRTRFPVTICLLVLVGVMGGFGFPQPAHATSADPAAESVELPPIFDNLPSASQRTKTADSTDHATFTFAPFTAHEQVTIPPTDDTTETSPGSFPATCALNASPFTSLTPSITLPIGSFLFKCTATDTTDNSSNPSIAFIALTVVEPGPVFDNLPGNQTKKADGTDTATFTFANPVTAHEPGEPLEAISVVCKTAVSPIVTVTSPITLPTHAPGQGQNGGSYMFICTATDTTDGGFLNGFFRLTVLDEHTVLSNPGNQTATAGPDDMATISYSPVTATESSGDSDGTLVSCTAETETFFVFPVTPSGGTFPLGVNTVTCGSSIDSDGTNPPGPVAANISFKVTVTDQPVTLTVPPNQVVNATSPAGATVTYTPGPVTAVEDSETETIPITCTADNGATSGDGFVSGGNFPIGDTTVTCTATDNVDGVSTTGSFVVHVKGAAEQISDLISLVDSFNLNHGIQNSLDVKLQHALNAVNAGDTKTACNLMGAFTNEVQAQSGTQLTVDQANQLLAAATRIQAVLGC